MPQSGVFKIKTSSRSKLRETLRLNAAFTALKTSPLELLRSNPYARTQPLETLRNTAPELRVHRVKNLPARTPYARNIPRSNFPALLTKKNNHANHKIYYIRKYYFLFIKLSSHRIKYSPKVSLYESNHFLFFTT